MSAPKLWIVLSRCHRTLSQLAERSIANTGLCLTDFMVLEVLLHRGPLTISEIQQKVLLASGSMTAAVDRLEKKQLVIRTSTAEDRRAKVIQLTPAGRLLIEAAFEKHAQDLEDVMSVLSNKERQELYQLVKKIGLFAKQREEMRDDSNSKE